MKISTDTDFQTNREIFRACYFHISHETPCINHDVTLCLEFKWNWKYYALIYDYNWRDLVRYKMLFCNKNTFLLRANKKIHKCIRFALVAAVANIFEFQFWVCKGSHRSIFLMKILSSLLKHQILRWIVAFFKKLFWNAYLTDYTGWSIWIWQRGMYG